MYSLIFASFFVNARSLAPAVKIPNSKNMMVNVKIARQKDNIPNSDGPRKRVLTMLIKKPIANIPICDE